MGLITDILVPKDKDQILDDLSAIYKVRREDIEIDFLMNLHMMVNILTTDQPVGKLTILDYETAREYKEDDMPTIGLVVYTKNIKIDNKINSFKQIYEEIKNEIREKSIKHDGSNFRTDIKENRIDRIFDNLIQVASNMISVQGRRGPANFVLMNSNNLKKLKAVHFKTIIDDEMKDNEIIVGRNGARDEPGCKLVLNENKYKIEFVGKHPECQYVRISL